MSGSPRPGSAPTPEGSFRRADEANYRALIEQVPGILYVSEAGFDGRWLYVSPQVEVLLGWTPAEWLADPTLFSKLIHPDDRHVEEGAELPENTPLGGRHTSEYRLTTRDGVTRWFRDDATLLAAEKDRPRVWSGVLTDITELRLSERELRRSDARGRVAIDTAMDAYVAIDGEGYVRDWNRAAERVFGWSRDEILGRILADTLIPERLRAAHVNGLRRAAAGGDPKGAAIGRTIEVTAVRRDGQELSVELTMWRTIEEDVVEFSAFLRDITERKALESRLIHQAHYDSLTGLGNRTLFHSQVAQRLATPAQVGFAILLISLDDFRSVSDSLGRAAADELLRRVADLLRAEMPTQIFARISGDELAMLLVEVGGADAAQAAAESLQGVLRSRTRIAGGEITMRVSIGVRLCAPDVDATVEELMSDAGAAMFTATRGGRGVAVFENGMRVDRLRRLRLTEDLEHAVDRGEISVHYQPYFSFSDGRPCGVEALARWHHRVHGEVSPAEFILIAESSGAIHSLGLFVLRRACHDIGRLRQQYAYRDLTLGVNVSAHQLRDGRLQQELPEILRDSGLPGAALMLELTETALVEDVHGVEERLAAIRAMGVRLAVDDFGTRYASLAYLQRFPIDTLKVDRSFVRRVDQSPHDQRLTGAIITLAKTLGLRTIAEGIEEVDHAVRLSGLGCDAGQGFLFARPVSFDGLVSALRSGRQRMKDGLVADRGPVPGFGDEGAG